MPPEDVGDTVGQDPTQGSRLRPKTEQVLSGGSILNPPSTGSRLQHCCSRICCSPESFDEIVLASVEMATKMHRPMQCGRALDARRRTPPAEDGRAPQAGTLPAALGFKGIAN